MSMQPVCRLSPEILLNGIYRCRWLLMLTRFTNTLWVRHGPLQHVRVEPVVEQDLEVAGTMTEDAKSLHIYGPSLSRGTQDCWSASSLDIVVQEPAIHAWGTPSENLSALY